MWKCVVFISDNRNNMWRHECSEIVEINKTENNTGTVHTRKYSKQRCDLNLGLSELGNNMPRLIVIYTLFITRTPKIIKISDLKNT